MWCLLVTAILAAWFLTGMGYGTRSVRLDVCSTIAPPSKPLLSYMKETADLNPKAKADYEWVVRVGDFLATRCI
jgi:hypothetical protein